MHGMENVKFLIQYILGDKSKHETHIADSRHMKSKMLAPNPVEDCQSWRPTRKNLTSYLVGRMKRAGADMDLWWPPAGTV